LSLKNFGGQVYRLDFQQGQEKYGGAKTGRHKTLSTPLPFCFQGTNKGLFIDLFVPYISGEQKSAEGDEDDYYGRNRHSIKL